MANLYASFVNHPNVLRVFALSGGYSRDDSNRLLSLNNGMLASFSRALTEGLSVQQSDDEFNSKLDASNFELNSSSDCWTDKPSVSALLKLASMPLFNDKSLLESSLL